MSAGHSLFLLDTPLTSSAGSASILSVYHIQKRHLCNYSNPRQSLCKEPFSLLNFESLLAICLQAEP